MSTIWKINVIAVLTICVPTSAVLVAHADSTLNKALFSVLPVAAGFAFAFMVTLIADRVFRQ